MQDFVVSLNRGSILQSLIMGTPKKVLLILGDPHLGI